MQEQLFSQLPTVVGVSRAVDYIRRMISRSKALAGIRVRGEVSGLSRHPSGRAYFDLKEGSDILRCVAWADDAAKLPRFKDGDEIIAGGEFGTFAQRSQYQLFVKAIELTGIGALYAEFEKLKERFAREGLFDAARKRAMPLFPRRIALISARGRGAEDFLTTVARRAPFLCVDFVETRVQGDGAQIDIAEAIDRASRLAVDVIVLTRGGGSYEDLFPFNLEPVVRAIVRANKPVLSAIGHTPDLHLSDLVADWSCETPSNAAHFFGEIADRFTARVSLAQRRLEQGLRDAVRSKAQRVDYAASLLKERVSNTVRVRERRLQVLVQRLDLQTPHRRLSQRHAKLTELSSRLESSRRFSLSASRQRLQLLDTRLRASDPFQPLTRGYAVVSYQGKAVRDAQSVPAGEQIDVRLQRGSLTARVEETRANG